MNYRTLTLGVIAGAVATVAALFAVIAVDEARTAVTELNPPRPWT